MATGERRDPFRAFNFQLEIDNIARGAFSECSGLTADGDAVDYREGTDLQPNVRKLVGLRKYTNITLKRGYTQDDTSLWDWYKNIHNGVADRRNVTIILMNEERAAGDALARRECLDQQDRRADLQGERQRSRHRIGRAGP